MLPHIFIHLNFIISTLLNHKRIHFCSMVIAENVQFSSEYLNISGNANQLLLVHRFWKLWNSSAKWTTYCELSGSFPSPIRGFLRKNMCWLAAWAERESTLVGNAGQVLGIGLEEGTGTESRTPMHTPKSLSTVPALTPGAAQHISLLCSPPVHPSPSSQPCWLQEEKRCSKGQQSSHDTRRVQNRSAGATALKLSFLDFWIFKATTRVLHKPECTHLLVQEFPRCGEFPQIACKPYYSIMQRDPPPSP